MIVRNTEIQDMCLGGIKQVKPQKQTHGATVKRFTPTEIVYHWAQALPCLALISSGGYLLAAHFVGVEAGARQTLRTVHLVAAALQIALPVLVFLVGDRSVLLANLREALHWRRCDVVWMWRMQARLFYPDVELPEVAKFNPGQKLSLLLVIVGIPVMAASGAVMYLSPGVLLAWYLHIGISSVILALLVAHLFMVFVNPSSRHALRAILVGNVSRNWAAEHHGGWLRGVSEEPPSDLDTQDPPSRSSEIDSDLGRSRLRALLGKGNGDGE